MGATALRALAFLIIVISALATPQVQAGILIDFDDVTGATDYANATPLTDHYQPLGVTFSGPSASSGGIIMQIGSSWGVPPHSGPNVLAFANHPDVELQTGGRPITPEYIYFNSPVNSVSIWATGSWEAETFYMDAYNSANVLVDHDQVTTQDWAKLEVTGQGISKVILNRITTDLYGGAFDDLSFEKTGVPIPNPPPPTPIPGAIWLLGSALLGLAALRRFRKV